MHVDLSEHWQKKLKKNTPINFSLPAGKHLKPAKRIFVKCHNDEHKYNVYGHYLSSYFYVKTPSSLFFKTQRFGYWILSPSSGKNLLS
jgi:hypothetical protein